MAKTSIYRKNDYILTFGADDVIFLDVEIEVIENNPLAPTYEMKIIRSQLAAQMEFSRYILNLLDATGLEKINKEIELHLTQDLLETTLKTLFYMGDLQQNEQQSA